MNRALQIAFQLLRSTEKTAGVGQGLYAAGKGFLGSGKHISNVMTQSGVQSPTAHFVAKAAPYAAAAYGGVKAKEGIENSETYQKLKYRMAVRAQRKAMEAQQRGEY
jgi:hypothetical protein